MRRAVRYGDGWLPYFYGPDRYAASVERITAMAQEDGRSLDGFQWAHYAFITIAESREEAMETAVRQLGGRYNVPDHFRQMVETVCVLGTVDDCVEGLRRYVRAGARHITFAWTCPREQVARHVETTINEIVPRLMEQLA